MIMTPPEIDKTLKTFSVIVDTREQVTPRSADRLKSINFPIERRTLSYGDYAGCIRVSGKPIFDASGAIAPKCVIERKMSLDELAMCFTRGRERFQREFERARSNKAKVFLLIEDGTFEGIINHRYKSRYHPEAFMASLIAWSVRYNMTPMFCKAGTSGKVIREILYRDMKERLVNGEYG